MQTYWIISSRKKGAVMGYPYLTLSEAQEAMRKILSSPDRGDWKIEEQQRFVGRKAYSK